MNELDDFATRYSEAKKSDDRFDIDSKLTSIADQFNLENAKLVLEDEKQSVYSRMVAAVIVGSHSQSGRDELALLFRLLRNARLQDNLYGFRLLFGIKNLLARGIELPSYQRFLDDLAFFDSIGRIRTQKLVKAIRHLIDAPDNEGGIRIRPIFGTPSEERQFRCDVFVIMPFADSFAEVQQAIMALGIELDLSMKRGDNFQSNYHIIDEIWYALHNANLVIADCTGSNPNVFYELGIAHCLGKPTIIITQDLGKMPFDIQSRRQIRYGSTPDGLGELKDELKRALVKILFKRD